MAFSGWAKCPLNVMNLTDLLPSLNSFGPRLLLLSILLWACLSGDLLGELEAVPTLVEEDKLGVLLRELWDLLLPS